MGGVARQSGGLGRAAAFAQVHPWALSTAGDTECVHTCCILVLGHDSHFLGLTVDPHLDPRPVPKIHHQTQHPCGSRLKLEPQTQWCWGVCSW